MMDDGSKIGPNRGNAGKGRPKGALNKTTQLAKEAIAQAFDELGGTQGLVDWASSDPDNQKVFYATIWPKIIPVQTEISGRDGGALQITEVRRIIVDPALG